MRMHQFPTQYPIPPKIFPFVETKSKQVDSIYGEKVDKHFGPFLKHMKIQGHT